MNYYKSEFEIWSNNSDTVLSNHKPKKIIAVSSQKGGVGKSTTAINLAAYLGHAGYNTILMDMDPQSNSTFGLGINYKSIGLSVYDVLVSNENPNKAVVKSKFKNLNVIPACWKLTGAESELAALNGSEFRLREGIEKLSCFDGVLVRPGTETRAERSCRRLKNFLLNILFHMLFSRPNTNIFGKLSTPKTFYCANYLPKVYSILYIVR